MSVTTVQNECHFCQEISVQTDNIDGDKNLDKEVQVYFPEKKYPIINNNIY